MTRQAVQLIALPVARLTAPLTVLPVRCSGSPAPGPTRRSAD
jgi:hypothetical protein